MNGSGLSATYAKQFTKLWLCTGQGAPTETATRAPNSLLSNLAVS